MPYSPGAEPRSHLCCLWPCRLRALLSSCVLTLVLTGCSSGPPPKLYLLEPMLDLATEPVVPRLQSLGLSEVSLPKYAQDTPITTRVDGGRIVQDPGHRWAEPPVEAITRVMANKLRALTGSQVVIEPWPRGYEPQARIDVAFDKLLREPSGGVEMSGQVRLIAGDGRSMLGIESFQVVQFGSDAEPLAFFEATATALNEVMRVATAALAARFN